MSKPKKTLSHAVDQLKDEGDYFVVVGERVFTRTTAHDYTHVVVVRFSEGEGERAGEVIVWSWHGSRANAEKTARSKYCRRHQPVVEAINNGERGRS